jgi:hypothetical protein
MASIATGNGKKQLSPRNGVLPPKGANDKAPEGADRREGSLFLSPAGGSLAERGESGGRGTKKGTLLCERPPGLAVGFFYFLSLLQ